MDAQVTLGAARASHQRWSIVDAWRTLRRRWTAANAHAHGRPSALNRAGHSADVTHGKERSIYRIAESPLAGHPDRPRDDRGHRADQTEKGTSDGVHEELVRLNGAHGAQA
jgi:hypothetical protein